MRCNRAIAMGVGVATVALLASACSSGGNGGSDGGSASGSYPPIPDGPIKIGVSAPLSGALAETGFLVKAYWEETIKIFNEKYPDGIDGHPVELDLQNDASDTTTAVNVANKMVENKDAIIGTVTYSFDAAPLQMAIFMKAKVPVIATQPLNAFSDVSKYPYFFNNGQSYSASGAAFADWLSRHPEIKTIGTLGDGSGSSDEALSSIKDAIEEKGLSVTIVKEVQIAPGAVEVSAPIADLKSANPDLLAVQLGYGYGPVWQALHSTDWSPAIFTPAAAWYDGFDGMGTLATKAYTAAQFCATDNSPKYPAEAEAAMEKFYAITKSGFINYPLAYWVDLSSLEILKAAAEKIHSVDPDGLKKTLESMGETTYLDGLGGTNYTADDHYALSGGAVPQVCNMSPLVGGKWAVPMVSP